MAAEETGAAAETAAPKMRVKLMLSHPANTRPKVKMAKMDGCTFFRRVVDEVTEDRESKGQKVVWLHKPCKRTDHWIWSMEVRIGGCTLVRRNKKWEHIELCYAAAAYLDSKKAAEEAIEALGKEQDKQKAVELVTQVKKFWAMEEPECLAERDLSEITVGGCGFFPDGDVFKHRCVEDRQGNPTLSCKQREHYQDFGNRKVRLTREPGWNVNEFAAKANETIGQALATIPPDAHRHITVEV